MVSGESTGEDSGDSGGWGGHPSVSLGQVSTGENADFWFYAAQLRASLHQLHASHKDTCYWQATEGCQGEIFTLVCVASRKPTHLTRSDVFPETNQPRCTLSLSANARNFHSRETKAELVKKSGLH